MSADPRSARKRAEAQFDKTQKTKGEAVSQIESDLQATRTKTAKLKVTRLAKEARDRKTELDGKQVPRHERGEERK